MFQALNSIPHNLQENYQQRANAFEDQVSDIKKRTTRLALLRLIYFFVAIFSCIYIWTNFAVGIGLLATLSFAVGFFMMIKRYLKLQQDMLVAQALADLNSSELEAQNNNYSQFDAGASFFDAEHPYTADLDVFGESSLFQYINRGQTSFGKTRLAEWLSRPESDQTILQRQASVESLKLQEDFRQYLVAHAAGNMNDQYNLDLLKDWFVGKDIIRGTWMRLMPIVAMFCSVVFIGLQFNYLFELWTFLVFLPVILVLRKTLQGVNDLHHQTGKAQEALQVYANVLKHCESFHPTTPYLKEKYQLIQSAKPASEELRSLGYLVNQLNVRYNVFVLFLNLLGAWDLYWVYRLEQWRANNHKEVLNWFDFIGEIEAICSLANLAYNHPDWTLPEITEEQNFKGIGLGHPLLRKQQCVSNDFSSPTSGHTKLLTGSNMAGKSTFLRTIGLNIVLANAGSVVCAASLQLPVLQVITSMRNTDNLHDSTSSFYAELKRIRKVIQLVKSESNVFYLLDEILKGTNSTDRHKGSKALILQLINDQGAGIVATHDLELGKMEKEYPGLMENICLEVDINGNELEFDYKLRKGVCKSLNASILMKNMGIEL